MAFERSGQDGSRGSPQICSTTCQRHSDEVPRPPWPSSGFKSRIREIFGEGAASDAGCSAILRRFSASDAGRSAILRRVSLVDPRDPFPCARWIGGHGSRPPAGRAEGYARDAGVGLQPASSLRRQLLPCAVPSLRNFDGLGVADGAVRRPSGGVPRPHLPGVALRRRGGWVSGPARHGWPRSRNGPELPAGLRRRRPARTAARGPGRGRPRPRR